MILLDTNIIIYYLQGDQNVAEKIDEMRKAGEVFVVSVVAKIELLSYPNITQGEIDKIETFLKEFKVVILDEILAGYATKIRRDYKITLADSIIAATSQMMNIPLLTRNFRHFKKIKEITVRAI